MTYIKQAIDIINALGRYDFNEYSQLVYYVLKGSVSKSVSVQAPSDSSDMQI